MTLTAPERADIAEAAEKLAERTTHYNWNGRYCAMCDAHVKYADDITPIPHTPSCLVTKLRAIAAREEEQPTMPSGLHELDHPAAATDKGCVAFFETRDDLLKFMDWLTRLATTPLEQER